MIAEREHESTRIEAFSDAMFAFAATLLVVSLEVPRDFGELLHNLRGFVPFAFSFSALYFIWVAHTNMFRRYALGDTYTVILNGILLFTVLFYVYPLKFMANVIVSMWTGRSGIELHGQQVNLLFIVYGLGWTLVFLMIALLYRHAYKTRPQLGIDALAAYDAQTHSRHYLGFVIVGILSVVLAFFDVGIRYGVPGFVYALVGPFSAINGSARRKAREVLQRVGTGEVKIPPSVTTPSSPAPPVTITGAHTGAH
ncbi:MAG TPA: TMEM175 family protein [Gemmatimonadaceae bacterium]|nr:TMEM175 family protein [Gemmatimonadaceae bacterium]